MNSLIFPLVREVIRGSCLLCFVALLSCKKKTHEPAPWQLKDQAEQNDKNLPQDEAHPLEETITFLSYNVKNYLSTPVYKDGQKVGNRYKPENEIEALVSIIAEQKPDVLGLCEIGTLEDLNDLRSRLQNLNLSYPHAEHVQSFDSVRHLALLSNLPMSSRRSQKELTYTIGDKRHTMKRGILDVTLQADQSELRFVGVHLKSKRKILHADQAKMRLREALLLRTHLDQIFVQKPETQLIVYGDLNDHFRSPAVDMIKGAYRAPNSLIPLSLSDSHQQYWTHFWEHQRVYSTFDYVMVSQNLKPYFDKKQSYIVDGELVLLASDHRPLFVTFGKN